MDTKIIYFRETCWQSWLSDAGSFLTLVGAMAINHYYLGDSWIWALFLFVMLIMSFAAKGNSQRTDFTSMEELKKYLDKHHDH